MADNYLHFGGADWVEAPAIAAYDLVNFVDVEVKLAPADWSPAATMLVIDQYVPNVSGWRLGLEVDGEIHLSFRLASAVTIQSQSAAFTLVDGAATTVRATIDAAAGNIVYYENGVQVDTDTFASGSTIVAYTDDMFIGATDSGSAEFIGEMYHVIIRDAILGVPVFFADFTKLTAADLAADSFVEDSVNAATCTIVGDEWAYVRPVTVGLLGETELVLQSQDGNKGHSAKWADRSGNNHHAQNGSAPGADTNDALFKGYEAADGQYVYLPGTNDNYVSTPNVNLLDADTAHFVQGKSQWRNNTGTDGGVVTASGASAFGPNVLRFTCDGGLIPKINTGNVAFTDFVVSGSTEYAAGIDVLADFADRVRYTIQWWDGLVFKTQEVGDWFDITAGVRIRLTVSGVSHADADNCSMVLDFESNADAGAIFDLSAALLAAGSAASFVPSHNIVGDLDVRWAGAFDPALLESPENPIVARYASGTNNSYLVEIGGLGDGRCFQRVGGVTGSTVLNGIGPQDTARHSYQTTRVASSGLWSGYIDDVLVDTTVGTSGAIDSDSTASVEVGAASNGTLRPIEGAVEWAEVRDGIDGPIVVRFDASRLAKPFENYTDTQRGNVWTVNRGSTGLLSTVIDQDTWLYTTDDYMVVPDHPGLNFAGGESFTILVAARMNANRSQSDRLVDKRSVYGYGVSTGVGDTMACFFDDFTGGFFSIVGTAEAGDGEEFVTVMRLDNVTGGQFVDGVADGTPVTLGGGTLTDTPDFNIGVKHGYTLNFYEGEIMAVALWRRALTDAEIVQAAAELVNLPAEAISRHGDGLLNYIRRNYPNITSPTVVGALNEFNGIYAPPRKEYAEARDTAFGINGH